jgi:aconitate hydratase
MAETYKKTQTRVAVEGKDFDIGDGDVMIAAITSCTNTSNPGVLVAAGLVAKKADELGLKPKPWVKTSLAPGSAGRHRLPRQGRAAAAPRQHRLQPGRLWLHHLHRQLRPAGRADQQGDQRERPRRRRGDLGQPQLRRPRLARRARKLPRLAAAGGRLCAEGHRDRRFHHHPDRQGSNGQDVYLKDIWPTNAEVYATMTACVDREMFQARYADVYKGDKHWQAINVTGSETYQWRAGSTYVANPPYFEGMTMTPAPVQDIVDAKPLLILGDSITTDHISPAGNIKADSPAGEWLMEHQVAKADFNSYGARRGHHEVMMRGTFANIRIKNEMVPGIEGGMSRMAAK